MEQIEQKCYKLSFLCLLMVLVTNFPTVVILTNISKIPMKYEKFSITQSQDIQKKLIFVILALSRFVPYFLTVFIGDQLCT